jgi:hypothetical protein
MSHQISGPGGVATSTLCPKHGVPMTSTITDDTLCAVCEKVRADKAEIVAATMGWTFYGEACTKPCEFDVTDMAADLQTFGGIRADVKAAWLEFVRGVDLLPRPKEGGAP